MAEPPTASPLSFSRHAPRSSASLSKRLRTRIGCNWRPAQTCWREYDPAIDILDRLLAAGPVTADLLTDDASAYFQRGTATGSENDRATALDYLRRADELSPDDPVVLFNEALVMEDRGQVMNAVETWNRYLKFERDPRWQEEGRQPLEGAGRKAEADEDPREPHGTAPCHPAGNALTRCRSRHPFEHRRGAHHHAAPDSSIPLPLPVDRSRGSPCEEKCQAAAFLLHCPRCFARTIIKIPGSPSYLPRIQPRQAPLSRVPICLAARTKRTHGETTPSPSIGLQSRGLFHGLRKSGGGRSRGNRARLCTAALLYSVRLPLGRRSTSFP